MKYPWMQFFTGDWLKDPALSICSPATRGIWIDLLCAMHELDRSGELRGTPEQLARVARCRSEEIVRALTELQTTGAADATYDDGVTFSVTMSRDVTRRNTLVTITNRRMKKEANARNGAVIRKRRQREKEYCHDSVTPHKSEVIYHKSEVREEREPLDAHTLKEKSGNSALSFSEIPSWVEFWEYCQSLHCGLAAEWFAKDKWEAANAENWQKTPNWRAYARRCKGWWQADGKPMQPKGNQHVDNRKKSPNRNAGTYNDQPLSAAAKSKIRGLAGFQNLG